jgi:hypothetical protein
MYPRFSGFVLQWVVQLELIQARNWATWEHSL